MQSQIIADQRKMYSYPLTLEAGQTSGWKQIELPFPASNIAVLNSSTATISYQVGQATALSPDAVPVAPGVFIGMPMITTDKITIFWSSTNPISSTSGNQVVIVTSNLTISVSGGAMQAGGVSSNVTVTSIPSISLGAGTNNIGHVDVDALPALPAGANSIGNVGLNAGINNIGHVDVDALPALPAGANTIGNVGLNAGTNNIGSVDIASTANLAQAATTGIASASQEAVGTGAAALTMPTNVRQIAIQNTSSSATLYIGPAGVTTATGFPIGPNSTFVMDVVPNATALTVYAIGSAALTAAVLGVA